MTVKRSVIRLILLSFSFILFSSCQLFFDEISECINKISPKLPPKILVQGQVGVEYFESIQAEVKNADDDTFNYEFSLESGYLPSGISFMTDGRLLKLYGSPVKAGTFAFEIKVRIPSGIYGPGDGICFGKDYDKQEYEIVVLE